MALTQVSTGGLKDGTILNADINANAAIAKTKLASLDIVNADINASAAIAGSKISPSFTSNIAINTSFPSLFLTDTEHNSDFSIQNQDGTFAVKDETNSTTRLTIDSSGVTTISNTLTVAHDITSSNGDLILSSGQIRATDTIPAIFTRNVTGTSSVLVLIGNNTQTYAFEASSSGFSINDYTSVNTARFSIDSSGNSKVHKDLIIESNFPRIFLTDNDTNPDYSITNANGKFAIYDETNGADRFTINSSGNSTVHNNLGIGTENPSRRLVVTGDTDTVISSIGTTNGTSSLFLGDTDDEDIGALTYNHVQNSLSITVNTSPAITIDSSGTSTFDGVVAIGGTSVSGGEGGEIRLTQAPNSTLAGNEVVFDQVLDRLRFFESVSPFKGAFLDISQQANGVASQIMTSTTDVVYSGAMTFGKDTTSGGPYVLFHNRGTGTTDSTGVYNIGGISAAGYRDVANPGIIGSMQFERVPTVSGFSSGCNIAFRTGFNGTNSHTSGQIPERMRITFDGRVGINTASPANMLEVKNNTTVIHPASFRMIGAHQYASAIMDNDGANGGGSATFVSCRMSNSIKGDITFNGSVMVYGGQSDYRLKENVAPITDGIAKLKQLNPLRYNFIDNPNYTCEGFFAHEAQAICPQSATGTKDEIATEDIGTAVKKGDPIYQQMDYSKLVPILVAALKEAVSKMEILETEVAALKAS